MTLEDLVPDIKKLIADIRNNEPQLGSDKFFSGDSDDITTGTSLTVTWTLNPQWITHLVKTYADDRAGCTYSWFIDGKAYSLNEVEFYKGRIISGEQVTTVTLIIANASGSTQTIGYFLQGWGNRREGL